jgi:hypothetical protein
MAKQLTELQQKFLDALFGEAEGDPALAKKLAGYSPDTAAMHIVNSLKEEIIEQAQLYLALHAPKASQSMVDVMKDPVALGNDNKLKAAAQILDRVGIAKQEKVEVKSNASGIFLLPAKRTVETTDEDAESSK